MKKEAAMNETRERLWQTVGFWTMIGIVWVLIALIALFAVWLFLGTGEGPPG